MGANIFIGNFGDNVDEKIYNINDNTISKSIKRRKKKVKFNKTIKHI